MRLATFLKTMTQLPAEELFYLANYRLGLRSGKIDQAVRQAVQGSPAGSFRNPWPEPGGKLHLGLFLGSDAQVLSHAEEILSGMTRRYGGAPTALRLEAPLPLRSWQAYGDTLEGEDIKDYWEDARFGWAVPLARAYRLSGDARFAAFFWTRARAFIEANPLGMGPHWASAQEAALRLITWLFCLRAFEPAETPRPDDREMLIESIYRHAARIPPTLAYSRAQNNNHLLSEAVGLLAAGLAFPEDEQARGWKKLGWSLFNRCLNTQFSEDGEYIQHSSNYQRLALMLSLLGCLLGAGAGYRLDPWPRRALTSGCKWLLARCDPVSGQMALTGHHDGADFLPLHGLGLNQPTPVINALLAWLGQPSPVPPGAADELCCWLAIDPPVYAPAGEWLEAGLNLGTAHSWASLRVWRGNSRPAHADMLQVDIWRKGVNVVSDSGTYRYNAPPPWENGLAGTRSHNTVSVNNLDQAQRAGKFLWLDWLHGEILERTARVIHARHDGYRRWGIEHRRRLELADENTWRVVDTLTGPAGKSALVCLRWLLRDYPFQIEPYGLTLDLGSELLSLEVKSESSLRRRVTRAGQIIAGEGEAVETDGWISPTYGLRQAAVQYCVEANERLPVQLITTIQFRPAKKAE